MMTLYCELGSNMYVKTSTVSLQAWSRKIVIRGIDVNIAIWLFFTSWRSAVDTAMAEASNTVPAIIEVVDPEKKTNVGLNLALTAFSIGLGFIPIIGPEFAGLSALTITAANLALDGIKKAPGVAASIWPVDTENSQPQQTALLTGSISRLQNDLLVNLGLGLALVQGFGQENVSKFLAFVGGGNFSEPQMNLPHVINDPVKPLGGLPTVLANPLLLAFNTYLVSTALAQNGWHVLQVPG